MTGGGQGKTGKARRVTAGAAKSGLARHGRYGQSRKARHGQSWQGRLGWLGVQARLVEVGYGKVGPIWAGTAWQVKSR